MTRPFSAPDSAGRPIRRQGQKFGWMSTVGTAARRARNRDRNRLRPAVMVMEERALLSTLTVTNDNDSGTGSLRAELAAAASGDTIQFAPAAYGTITLSSGVLTVATAVTIEGPGAGEVTVSGGGKSGVFQIESGVTATISGLTITDGSAYYGGGVDNDGTVTLTGCTLSGNSAVTCGGALYSSGAATLTDCTVSGNTSSEGAGLAVKREATITDSTFSGNSGGQNGIGGALYEFYAGDVTLTGCTFTGNVAENGGALYDFAATLTLTDCTLTGNSAKFGGAISNAGQLALTNCTITGNSASSLGGGLYNGDAASGDLTNTIVAGNVKSGSVASDILVLESAGIFEGEHNLIGTGGSGGLANGVSGNIVLTSLADLGLGTLGNYGGPTQTIPVLPGSAAIGAGKSVNGVTADQRGEIVGSVVDIGAFQTSLVVESAAGSVNTTAAGMTLSGAVSLANQFPGSAISFDSTVFSSPTTITPTALLTLSDTSLSTSITGPAAGVSVSGGGSHGVFAINSGVTATLSGLTITDGSATSSGGGVNNAGTLTLTGCVLSGNASGTYGNGGGLYSTGPATLTDCTISGNSTQKYGGGALFTSSATIADSTFTGNSAETNGGAIFDASASPLTAIGSTFTGNTASQGGAVFTASGTGTTFTECTISGNSAETGGGFDFGGGRSYLTGCTITANYASSSGGGLYNISGTPDLTNCIVAGNTGTGGVANDIASSGTPIVGGANLIGTGFLLVIPVFGIDNISLTSLADLGLGTLGNYGGPTETIPVLPGSAAIGAGISVSGITTDQRGVALPATSPDIGAFQDQGFSITVVGGGTQTAGLGQPFSTPLTVLVQSLASDPVAGGIVTFTPPSTGASADLGGTASPAPIQVTIGSNGQASTTATANGIAGGYSVTASAAGAATQGSFSLTNQATQPVFSGLSSPSIVYGTASVTLGGTILAGSTAPPGTVSITFAGTTEPATVAANGSFSAVFSSTGIGVAGSPYTITYAYAANGAYSAAQGSSQLTVTQATPAITWATPAAITYGTPLSASQLDATASVPGTFVYTPVLGTVLQAGQAQLLKVSFTPTDAIDYVSTSDSVRINVGQATPVLSVQGVNATYNGSPHPATFTITGVNGDNLTSLVSLTYNGVNTVPVNAGTYTITASFPGNSDYVAVTNTSQQVVIAAANTNLRLSSSANPSTLGQSVTLTAVVTAVSPGAGNPAGSVTFSNGATVMATVPLSVVNGVDQASYSTSSLSLGSSTITAAYSSSNGNDLGSSSSIAQVVNATTGVSVVGTTLYIIGASTSDYAQVSPSGSSSTGSTGLAVSATINNAYISKTFTQTFTAIDIVGNGGNDDFQLSTSLTLPTTVTLGNGTNYLQLGGGNDTVTLGTGSNQVFGGSGNKTITDNDVAGTSAYISLGNGNDAITMGAGNDQVVLGSGDNTVTAGNGNDSVTTTGSGNNSITLGNGNEYVNTGNGTDVIALGSGNEDIQTGNGTKTITAGNGNNYVSAGGGNVTVTMGNGADTALLGGGTDTVTLGNGNDYVSAGSGNDNVTVGNGNDTTQLGNGSDVIVEGNGSDYVSAGNGADLVVGGLGQHTIQLGNGNDILIDGSATVVNSGDSFRQILTDWNSSSSAQVSSRLNIVYNSVHPNYLSAGSGRDWFFYITPTSSNKKSTDRLN